MIFGLINLFRGYLVVTAESFFPERFINLCMRKGIFLWDIGWESKNRLSLKVSVKGFKKMQEPARKSKTRVKIKKRCGIPMFIHKYRRRKAFAAGGVIFLALVVFLCSFIWSVEIEGLKKIDENEVRNALNSCGIRVGVIKYNKSPSVIKEELLQRVPGLSWAWVYINGTKAVVEVKEKTLKPDILPAHEPCNIVASRDGVICDYIVKRGETVVKRGDVVKKGSLLVSGVLARKNGGTDFVHSEAEVYATVWYEKSGTFTPKRVDAVKSGEQTNRYTLSLFGLDIPLYFGRQNPYESSIQEKSTHQLKLWGDFYLPFVLTKNHIEQTENVVTKLTEDEARLYFGEKLFEEIKGKISPDTKIINKTFLHTLTDDGRINVRCEVECVEQIGEYKKIIGETN
ncbi:MAG: sporulation protein YqfD [Clostridia bacterium]|nr:sporulation protein YqfD [Clostridia bacterium]